MSNLAHFSSMCYLCGCNMHRVVVGMDGKRQCEAFSTRNDYNDMVNIRPISPRHNYLPLHSDLNRCNATSGSNDCLVLSMNRARADYLRGLPCQAQTCPTEPVYNNGTLTTSFPVSSPYVQASLENAFCMFHTVTSRVPHASPWQLLQTIPPASSRWPCAQAYEWNGTSASCLKGGEAVRCKHPGT